MAGVLFLLFAAASSGSGAIVTTLRFNPVPDKDMLPEARKEIADAVGDNRTKRRRLHLRQQAACSRGVLLHGSAPLHRSRALTTDIRSWS